MKQSRGFVVASRRVWVCGGEKLMVGVGARFDAGDLFADSLFHLKNFVYHQHSSSTMAADPPPQDEQKGSAEISSSPREDEADTLVRGLTLADIQIVETKQETTTATTVPLPQQPSSTTSSSDRHPSPKYLPYSTFRSFTIDGVHTDVWIQVFQDRVLLACSQLEGGRIGNWIFCKPTLPSTIIVQPASRSKNNKLDLDVTVLLGSRQEQPMLTVYAKRILTQVQQQQRPLVLGLALRNLYDPAVFRTVTKVLVQVWNDVLG